MKQKRCERCRQKPYTGWVIVASGENEYYSLRRRFCGPCVTDWWSLPQEQFSWKPEDLGGPHSLTQIGLLAKNSSVVVLAFPDSTDSLRAARALETYPGLKTRSFP